MPRRARVLACGAVGAGAVACAVAVAVPASTGCTTHQCDPSSYDYGPGSPGYRGKMTDPNTFETNGVDDKWLDYPPNVTINVHFPSDVGRAPVLIQGYVGISDTPNSPAGADFQPGNNWTQASGQLAQYFFLSSTGFSVNNNTCAQYYARFVVTFAAESLMLYGGAASPQGSMPLGDTWTWNGSAWTSQAPAVAPSVRFAPVAGTVGGRTYLFGGEGTASAGCGAGAAGSTVTPLNETWTWDGVAWTQLCPPQAPPPGRYDAASGIAMALDHTGKVSMQLVMFGGRGDHGDLDDLWAWDGTLWTEQPAPSGDAGAPSGPWPSARSGAAGAGLNGDFVLVGGTSNGGPPLAETWVWHYPGWRLVQPASGVPSPGARVHASAAAFGGNVVLFGGNDGTTDLDGTWLWDGAAWTQPPATGASPGARSSATMGVFDGALVLFGGSSGRTALGDTWTWDGRAWTERNVQGPSARAGAVAAAN